MSWSIHFIGEPEKVTTALTAQSDKLSGASKEEYDAALPHLLGLVGQNFGEPSPVVSIAASGHGHSSAPKPYNQCQVKLELLYGTLV